MGWPKAYIEQFKLKKIKLYLRLCSIASIFSFFSRSMASWFRSLILMSIISAAGGSGYKLTSFDRDWLILLVLQTIWNVSNINNNGSSSSRVHDNLLTGRHSRFSVELPALCSKQGFQIIAKSPSSQDKKGGNFVFGINMKCTKKDYTKITNWPRFSETHRCIPPPPLGGLWVG